MHIQNAPQNEPPKEDREGFGPSYSVAITDSSGGPDLFTLPPCLDATQAGRKDDLPEAGIDVLNLKRKLMAEGEGFEPIVLSHNKSI